MVLANAACRTPCFVAAGRECVLAPGAAHAAAAASLYAGSPGGCHGSGLCCMGGAARASARSAQARRRGASEVNQNGYGMMMTMDADSYDETLSQDKMMQQLLPMLCSSQRREVSEADAL